MPIMDAVLGGLLRTVLTRISRGRLPRTEGELRLPGLKAPVEVVRDRWGVPHIYAADSYDLFFAQGFVHAQDRMWQMELNRRVATGRLAELFGPVALDTDRTTLTFGFHRLGKEDWRLATPEVQDAVRAYVDGVNAFLQASKPRLPVEFTLLGHRPSAWSVEDTMAFTRVMIWQLSHAWYGEIIRSQLIQAVGDAHAAELEIHYPAANPVTLPEGIEFNRLTPEGKLLGLQGPFLSRGKGSNSWTVAAARTTTGHTYLCNDMHLALSTPGLWYLAHLVGGPYHVTGASLPGVPAVLVGHNARVAWGMTLAFTDCEDLFLEEFDPSDPTRYRTPEGWRKAEVIEESIPVKGRKQPHLERVMVTRHGPVISDVVGAPDRRLAVQSMALQPCPAFDGWLRLDRAAGWDDFVEAVRRIEAPQLNVAYADAEGNTGYWCTGRVPIRARGQGMVPAPGWDGEHEWTGEIPFEQMPHALNPRRGITVTANARIVPDGYPHFLGSVWMNGYRARRITEVLEAKPKLAPEDFAALQLDCNCIPGKDLAGRLASHVTDDPDSRLALGLLRGWDGVLAPDSIGGSVYEVVRARLVRNLIEPGLGAELTDRFLGKGFHPLLMSASEFYGHDTVVLLRMLDDPHSWWIAQAGGRQAMIERSLKEAIGWLRAHLGPRSEGWQWGRIHRAAFPHALGIQKPLDRVFNLPALPIGGDTDTPCQTAMAPDDPYDNKAWTPSFRQIVDLTDLTLSKVIVPPGQSGHLASPHYGDRAGPWARGEYQPMFWTREQVESAAEAHLRLVP